MNKNGDVSLYIITLAITFIIFIIIAFSICVLFINVYAVVYDYKMDLYNLNKNAVISVNKVIGSTGIYKYNKDEYIKEFKNALIKSYNLDKRLENGSKFIKKIDIREYTIYEEGDIDSITNKKIQNNTIHVVTNIKYDPFIFKFLFKDGICFKLHNDISIKIYN